MYVCVWGWYVHLVSLGALHRPEGAGYPGCGVELLAPMGVLGNEPGWFSAFSELSQFPTESTAMVWICSPIHVPI